MIKNSLLLLSFSIFIMSCSPSHDSALGLGSTDAFILNPNPDLQLRNAAQTVLTNRCNTCHGPSGAFTRIFDSDGGDVDMDALLEDQRYISLGNPEASFLYSAIFSVNMPGDTPANTFLSAEQEQDAIALWIEDIGIPAPVDGGGGDDTGDNNPPPDTANTFSQVESQVLTPFCYSGHNGSVQGRIAFTDYQSIRNTMVIPFNPDSLFLRVITDSNAADRMPRNQAALDQNLIDMVESWILGGALNN